jgi:hypothetical protein
VAVASAVPPLPRDQGAVLLGETCVKRDYLDERCATFALLAVRVPQPHRSRLASRLAELSVRAIPDSERELRRYPAGLAALSTYLDQPAAASCAALCTRRAEAAEDPGEWELLGKVFQALAAKLPGRQRQELAERLVFCGLDVVQGDTVYDVRPSLRLLLQDIPSGQLAELLKHPCCVGVWRVEILRTLGKRYRQSFRSVWDLVRWADENEPSLSLGTPPRFPRPSPTPREADS